MSVTHTVPPDTNPRKPRVLVVDDSATFRRVASELASRGGYDVVTASSGEEAFEKCVSESFDVVVSDFVMGALSGVQLCMLLRSHPSTQHVPFVLLTASDDQRSRFWARHAGADSYLAKESMRQSLVDEIGKTLLAKSARGRVAQPGPMPTGAALERLARLSDDLLFEAAVVREARGLLSHSSDRRTFGRAIVQVAADLSDHKYLALFLQGPTPSVTLHVRGPLPLPVTQEVLKPFGLADAPEIDFVMPEQTEVGPFAPGEPIELPILAGTQQLGTLRAWSGARGVPGRDKRTLDVLAREIGVIVHSVFLTEEMRHLALRDALTGLHNRRACVDQLESELERVRRHGAALCIALVDVDRFKSINDRFSHNVGDEVLRRIAKALASALRRSDLVARWGGEEFAIVMPNTTLVGARLVAERLRLAVSSMPPLDGGPDQVTVSVGVAQYDGHGSLDAFVDQADRALYRAKDRGRNRVEIEE